MEVVMGALSRLILKLGDLLVGEYKLQKGVKGEIMFLQPELESMQGALEDISGVPSDQLDSQDKIWASDVRELSYDMEDSIDMFMVRCNGGEPAAGPHGMRVFMERSLDLLTRFKIRRQIATDIRDIKRRVIEVRERRERYKIDGVVAKHAVVDPRLLAHYTKVAELVGIDDTRDELIKILIEGNQVSKQQGKIISIVGFGGLGKTTLANAVYEKLRGQFDCWAFVSVSQTPDMRKLFKGMLYELGKSINEETLDERQLIDEIRKFLQTKRYCIVIDDIWDISVWKMIRCALPDDIGGFIIITTTRILKVAEQVGGAYKLKPLCLDNSRKLLYRRIFVNEEKYKCLDEHLTEVSDKILKKCAGVPLAIITIASLLAIKGGNKMEWYEVYNSIGTGLENGLDVENMRKILSYSYYDLPPHLRTCLLYLSVFPEDYEIKKDRLIWMWIAEGFVQCEKQGKSLFELGESYFNELINRSMIQPLYDMHDSMIESCRVHDMVLDLIRSLSSEENFATILNNVHKTSLSKKARRLSVQNNMVDNATPWASMSTQQVRSVVAFSSAFNQMPALASFRVLRVLDLKSYDLPRGCDLKYLGNLFHLRYLGLGRTRSAQLPEEIGNLRFLQILDVVGSNISSLPSTVVQLRDLMCLRIDENTRVPNGIGSLTSLEELSTLYICDSTDITEELCHATELRVLDIFCRTEWSDILEKSLVACLCKLPRILSLSIRVQSGAWNFDALVAHRHLRRLELHDCWFSRLPDWMSPLLLDLSFLWISVRELQQEDLDILGRLPALRYLYLKVDHESLKIPRRFVVAACSFPCLAGCRLLGFVGAVVFQQGAMTRLTGLAFTFHAREVREIANSDGSFDLGLGNLLSLQDVAVYFRSGGANEREVEEAKAALSHAIEIHPNHPNVDIWG
ncbi:disease resistance protein RGA5-like isoform X2 [Phragmites australis]|nr:disease resistance protein RGA5-like isoform X2 [Phragmites australis]